MAKWLLFLMAALSALLPSVPDAPRYRVDLCGRELSYEGVKDGYRAGESVSLSYGLIATDTDYYFYLDDEPIHPQWEDGAFRIRFTMPAHDVRLYCRSENTMEYRDPLPTDIVSFTYSYFNPFGGCGYRYALRQSEDGTVTFTYETDTGEGNGTMDADASLPEKVRERMLEYGVYGWDGFDEIDEYVCDGDGFSLSVVFAGGESLSASGSNAYPALYSEFVRSLDTLFLPCVQALSERPEPLTLAFDANVTTGFEWSGRVLAGTSAVIDERAGGYASDPGEECGIGGTHYFVLRAVESGETWFCFEHTRGDENCGMAKVVRVVVEEDMSIHEAPIPAQCEHSGVVTAADASHGTVSLRTETLEKVTVRFDPAEPLPLTGASVRLYTDPEDPGRALVWHETLLPMSMSSLAFLTDCVTGTVISAEPASVLLDPDPQYADLCGGSPCMAVWDGEAPLPPEAGDRITVTGITESYTTFDAAIVISRDGYTAETD